MKYNITSVFVLCAAILSCSMEQVATSQSKTLTATLEETTLPKTSLNEADGIVRWTAGDKISLVSGSSITSASLTGGEGTANGSFSYEGPTPSYAIYASGAVSVSGTVATLSLSPSQTYSDASVFQSGIALMAGPVSDGHVQMKNAISILEVQLKGSQSISSISVSSGNSCLAGEGTIDLSAANPAFTVSSGQAHSVTLSLTSPITLSSSARPFYFVLPAGDYDDLTIAVSGSEGNAVFQSTASHSLTRSKVCVLSPMDVTLTGGQTYTWTLNATRYAANTSWTTQGKALDDSGTATMQWHKTNDDVYYGGAVSYSGTKSNNTYMVKSIWTGDYMEFTAPVRNLKAGTVARIEFTTVSNTKGPRHWHVQYKDGETWKYCTTLTETIGEERCAYGFIPKTSTSTAAKVTELATFSHDIANGSILFRMTCADGTHSADGSTTTLNASNSAAGIYFKSGTSVVITIDPTLNQDPYLSVSPLVKKNNGAASSYALAINTNQSWSVSSSDSNISFSKTSGAGYDEILVSCSESAIEGESEIIVNAGSLSKTAYLVRKISTFTNPIGATPDPYIWKEGATYWFIKANGSNGINLSSSSKLSQLNSTSTIWTAPTGEEWNAAHVWAPELFRIDGVWYIYYTAGRPFSEEGNYYKQRCGVLRCADDNPKTGTWEDMGKLNTGDYYAIDFTTFVYKGQRYAVWSGSPNATDIPQQTYIAKMSNPYTISSERVCISQCTLDWEMVQGRAIQEGMSILEHEGRIFLVYSCNGSWTKYYRLGMLTLADGADPMLPSSWTKSPSCVFYRCDDTADTDGVNGVGHCSFTKSPDGTEDWIVYHTKKRNDATYDSGRATFIKKISWSPEENPIFGEPCAYGAVSICPSGE